MSSPPIDFWLMIDSLFYEKFYTMPRRDDFSREYDKSYDSHRICVLKTAKIIGHFAGANVSIQLKCMHR
ncbi:MAG: hypothetical protein QXJ07_02950 [Candidatus Bathyarchaeia archaeon]